MNSKLLTTSVCLLATVAVCLAAVPKAARPSDDAEFFSKRRHDPVTSRHHHDPLLHHSFIAPLNHYDGADVRTFIYNYTCNMQYYKDGGPLFFHIHDSGVHSNRWIEGGLMYDLARELNGALFIADHRYSGHNIPTPTVSVDDLRHLTVENILADIAYQITDVRRMINAPNAPAILWGSDIGAKFAVWMRQKYPHLVQAAWSSSGRFQADPVTESFYNQLSWNIHNVNDQCRDRVQALFAEMMRLIEAGESETLQEQLNVCDPIAADSENDIAMFMEGMIYTIAEYVDSNHLDGLQSFCRDMERFPDDLLRSFARWREYIWGDAVPRCWHYNYAETVEYMRNETVVAANKLNGRRQFYYSRCSQLGYLKVTSDNGLFPNVIPASYHFQFCRDVFGEAFTEERLEQAARALHIQYGSLEQSATNVVYTNGLLDSWLDHGISDDVIPGSHVINLPFSAKSADMESIEDWQPAAVIAAKRQILDLLRQWSTPSQPQVQPHPNPHPVSEPEHE